MFFLQTCTIIAYLFNGTLGLVFSIIMYGSVWIKKKKSVFYKLMTCLFLAIPTYNIGVLGKSMHHMYSWYLFFTAITILYIIYLQISNRCKCYTRPVLIMSVLFILILLNGWLDENIKDGITDYIQIFVMIISITMIFQLRETANKLIKKEELIQIEETINRTIAATAVGVIIQYLSYTVLHRELGFISFFARRITYDLLFKGYSVLSIYLGVGVVINVKNLYSKRDKRIFKKISIILLDTIAIVMNSSRTGLYIAAIIVVIIILKNMIKNKKNMLITIGLIIIMLLCGNKVINILQNNRQGSDLFSDNGRFETYKNGIEVLVSSTTTLLMGRGISPTNYSFMMPHNAIIEISMKMGIIFSLVLLYVFFKLIKQINKKDFKYIIWYILLTTMFVTGFYAMTFIMAFLMFGYVYAEVEDDDTHNIKSIQG